jgi:hypothetical protein
MKKKLIAMLLCVTLIVAFPATAFAQSSQPEARCLPSSHEQAQAMRLYLMVMQANAEIELMVLWAKVTPYNDVPWLLREVERISDRVFDYAESIGAQVVCDYEPHQIDGQTVLIDPLRVVNV